MRDQSEIDKKVMWVRNAACEMFGAKCALIDINGIRCQLVVGRDEDGWEHVSAELMARRLPTWNEMCIIKDIFWKEDEEVIQIHPKKSQYVNITEALHLWRPVDGDWSIMNYVED